MANRKFIVEMMGRDWKSILTPYLMLLLVVEILSSSLE